jgi:hypothetical protein
MIGDRRVRTGAVIPSDYSPRSADASGPRSTKLTVPSGHLLQNSVSILRSPIGRKADQVQRDRTPSGQGCEQAAQRYLQHRRVGAAGDGSDDYTPPPLTLRALYPHNRHLSAKVRAFVDFLAGGFGREPPWDSWCRSPRRTVCGVRSSLKG